MKTITLTQNQFVATLRLNRPEVRNAFNAEMIEEITKACQQLQTDTNLRLVVLRGEGESFCAGGDLTWMKSMAKYTQAENLKDAQKLYEMFEAFKKIPVPTLCVIHGHAMGGGVGLVAASDMTIAVEDTKLSFSEVKLGLAPAVISSFVADKLSRSDLYRYFLTAEIFDAQKALLMGLVHEVVATDKVDSLLNEWIEKILKNGPEALRATKKLLGDLSQQQNFKNLTTELIARMRVSPEGQEGLQSFLEKRKPQWIGKMK